MEGENGKEKRFAVPDRKGNFPGAVRRTKQSTKAENPCSEETPSLSVVTKEKRFAV